MTLVDVGLLWFLWAEACASDIFAWVRSSGDDCFGDNVFVDVYHMSEWYVSVTGPG